MPWADATDVHLLPAFGLACLRQKICSIAHWFRLAVGTSCSRENDHGSLIHRRPLSHGRLPTESPRADVALLAGALPSMIYIFNTTPP